MVSVVIPAYNAESYIGETISSVINQTYGDWELILVDDGSTDNTANIIQEFCNNHSKIHYIHQANAGVSAARNKGISMAKGEYISFLDADDKWKATNLVSRINAFDDNTDWMFGSISLIDDKSDALNKVVAGNGTDILHSLLLWNGDVITTPSTITVKKKCLENISFDPNLSTAADQDFVFNLAYHYQGKHLNEALVEYRVLDNSMSRDISVMESDHIKVYKKAKKNNFFKSFAFQQKCFSNLYWTLAGSWWKNGDNKLRGFYFLILALFSNPLSLTRLFGK